MSVPQNKMLDNFLDKLLPQNISQPLDGKAHYSDPCATSEQSLDFATLAQSAREAEIEELRRGHELANDNIEGDISLKKMYGIAILIILTLWVAFVIAFMLVQVCSTTVKVVSDTTLMTVLGSATANILILPTVVLKYLFPNRGKE